MTIPDPCLARIEAFNLKNSGGVTIRKVRNGYNLCLTATDALIARLQPTGSNYEMRIRFAQFLNRSPSSVFSCPKWAILLIPDR